MNLEDNYQIFRFLADRSTIFFQIGCFEIIHFQDIEQFISEWPDILSDLKSKSKFQNLTYE